MPERPVKFGNLQFKDLRRSSKLSSITEAPQHSMKRLPCGLQYIVEEVVPFLDNDHIRFVTLGVGVQGFGFFLRFSGLPQLISLKAPQLPFSRGHKALNRGTLGSQIPRAGR